MEECPLEIIQLICKFLDFHDLTNLRLVSSYLSKTAAHVMISKVTFHCSPESFHRLKAFADHEVFRQQVTKLVFETNMLVFLNCEHAHAAHYQLEHHRFEQPTVPEDGSSARALRLWKRNKAKFDQDIKDRYNNYKELYSAQQVLVNSDDYRSIISYAISRFPRLTAITVYNAGKCKHLLSQRFLAVYGRDCSIPISSDTADTKYQLQHMLITDQAQKSKIENLCANAITHQFFSPSFQPQNKVACAFSNLKNIDLHFRLESIDRAGDPVHSTHCFSGLKDGGLRNALAAARVLEKLNVSFASCLCQVYCTDVNFIIGDTVWPKLKALSLDSLVANGDDLAAKLIRQPVLEVLDLGFVKLRDQSWIDVLEKLRKQLMVKDFFPFGVLEDNDEQYFMDWIDRNLAMIGEEETLAAAINDYVVWPSNPEDDLGENPLGLWPEYMPADEFDDIYVSTWPSGDSEMSDEDTLGYSDDDNPFLDAGYSTYSEIGMDIDDSDSDMWDY